MKNITKNILSTILIFALVVGCFAAIPIANAAKEPVPGTPAWDAQYHDMFNFDGKSPSKPAPLKGEYDDRGNASGDKITSNAHSGDYPGVYFRWDDKQKCPGVFLVEDWVFDLFVGNTFFLTAKNSNSYYKYKITYEGGVDVGNGVRAYGIPKEVMAKDNKGNDKKDELKNINMVFIDGQYKSAWVLITKAWFNEDGCLMWNIRENIALDKQVQFSNGLKVGLNEYDFGEIKITDFTTAAKGKTISITETAKPEGYAFKSACIIYGNGKNVDKGVSLTLKPGDKAAVHFENQKQKAELNIAKLWLDAKGDNRDAPEGGATFIFNGESDAVPGRYFVNEGKYTIIENPIKGFDLVEITGANSYDKNARSATITVAAGGKYTVTFTNQEPAKTYANNIAKNVNGKPFIEWFSDYDGDEIELFNNMHFSLDMIRGNIVDFLRVVPTPVEGRVDADGRITFYSNPDAKAGQLELDTLPDGTYKITETLSGIAKLIFEEPDPDGITFFVSNGVVSIKEFDYDAKYTIVNGYGGGYTLGYPGLNDNGDIFPISVRNTVTGDIYASFCANAGSKTFYSGDYMIVNPNGVPNGDQYEAFLKAYNYIKDTYGDLDKNRPITQIVTWCILEAIIPDSEEFNNINWAAVEAGTSAIQGITDAKTKVEDVLSKYEGYTGKGQIIDVVFMVGRDENGNPVIDDYTEAQPQLVPIYAPVINNVLISSDRRVVPMRSLAEEGYVVVEGGLYEDDKSWGNQFWAKLHEDNDAFNAYTGWSGTWFDIDTVVRPDFIWDKRVQEVTNKYNKLGGDIAEFSFMYEITDAIEGTLEFDNFAIAADNEFALFVNGRCVKVSDFIQYHHAPINMIGMTYAEVVDLLETDLAEYDGVNYPKDLYDWHDYYIVSAADMLAAVGNDDFVHIQVYAINVPGSDESMTWPNQSVNDCGNPAMIYFAGTFTYKQKV